MQIFGLPDALAARYIVLTRRMTAVGANLGPPHTDSFGEAGHQFVHERLAIGTFAPRDGVELSL